MSHLKSVSTLGYITMLLIIDFADCNLITMEKWGQSCFLEIQIFRFNSKTLDFLWNSLRHYSLQRKPFTWTIGSKLFHESLNEDEKFYINCKSLCNIHVFVEPPFSEGRLNTQLKLLNYTSLILITKNCLKRFRTLDFTTAYIYVRSLGCGTMQSHNFFNAYATLIEARYGDLEFYPLFRGFKAHSFHDQKEIIGPYQEFEKREKFKTDSDQTIAEIVMDSMNISVKNAINNIYTKITARFDVVLDRDIIFKVKFFTRIIQEQIVYCPKHKNYQKTDHLSLLFFFEPFHTCISIVIAITLITSALYLNITAGKGRSSIWKQVEMFMDSFLIVFQALLGQGRPTKTKSILLVPLGIAVIMLVSTYKDLIAVRLVAPENILERSFKNVSVLRDHNYHILCSHSLFGSHFQKLPFADDELMRVRLFCPCDCLLSKFILSNLLSEYEKSSLKNVGFYLRGRGDMYNGTSFEINSFLKRKTNCDSLENALSHEYSYIVYNNLRYLEAIFKTRLLQESGVTNFIERMDMYNKYEINNWSSINRKLKSSHPKYFGGVFRLAYKHIRPFAILLLGMLCMDFIAFLIEVYNFREKKAVRRIVHGCFGFYSYAFPFKTIQTKYNKTASCQVTGN